MPMSSSISGIYKSGSRETARPAPIEASRPALSREELEAVLQCLIEDQISSGSVAERFEKALAEATGQKKALAVNSPSAAYHLAFLALDTGPTTTVWMNTLTTVAALDAARYTGASVRLLDAGRDSFHPSAEALEKMMQELHYGDVFILDHVYGSPCQINPDDLRAKGVRIIEDITGVIGSTTEAGDPFGQSGDIMLCGLAEEDMITTGNGAFLSTAQNSLFKKMAALRYGESRDPSAVAYDYRLEDFQAAMGLNQLSRLGQMVNRRKKIGLKYLEALRLTKHQTCFHNPGPDAYHRMPVVVARPQDEVMRYFKSLHIGVKRIPTPLHHYLAMPPMEFPNAERLFRRSVCIPVYPALTANNVERIAGSLRNLI
jgi:dTDP-4-amino-4,6-dideoxygalactose transaminase